MKIVHAADLHIDSPLRGLMPYEGAPLAQVRNATRPAFVRLVDYCIEQRAALMLLAGDLYDGDWRDFSTGLFFAKEMSRLREAGVRVVSVRGNHDAASQITKALRLPENCRELGSRQPETAVYEDLGVAVHGRSFPEQRVTEDISRDYPKPVDGMLNIGLLHTCAEGRPGHDPYAPCKLESLRAHGYDYWALGHVHAREVLSRDPWVVFPGNLQGRHIREVGAKGATIIDVESGRIESVEHVALDVVRWAEVTVDVETEMQMQDFLDAAREKLTGELERSEGRVLAARIVARGNEIAVGRIAARREAVTAELQAIANDLGNVYFEKLRVAVAARARERMTGEWLDALAAISDIAPLELIAMADEALGDMRAKLPLELTTGPDPLRLDDANVLRALLEEAEQSILERARGETEE
jgi:DNA repair exonuclease SbcCD nuclease subunit